MIVCERRKFVFLHITKTAGSSLAEALGMGRGVFRRHIVQASTPKLYPDHLRFCFVRNPWDRTASAFRYSRMMAERGSINGDEARKFVRKNPDADLNRFVAEFLVGYDVKRSLHFRPQIHWIMRGEPQFIGRFERLEADVGLLARLIGEPIELSRVNVTEPAAPYAALYDDRAREIVGELYADDVRLLNYAFPGKPDDHDDEAAAAEDHG